MTPDAQILKLLADWSPDVTNLLKQSGYFSMPEGVTKEEIAKTIGFNKGGKLYNQVLNASLQKNGGAIVDGKIVLANPDEINIARLVLDEYSLRAFKAGAREVAGKLGIPFSQYDWNEAAQTHFEDHGLELVKNLTTTDLDSLKQRIQYDFNLNPKAFAAKYADSYSCSPSRLERLKRTETHTETQAGGYGFAGEADCQYAQWMCHPLGKYPRPSHRACWYEVVKYGEPFSIGQVWPSDPNCRCFLLFYLDKDHLDRKMQKAT